MKWLLARILGWRPRPEETVDERAGAKSESPGDSRPRLVFLIRDAAGPASYRLHTFDDAASASAFVQFWFPPGNERGTLAFWATHQEPVRRTDSNDTRPAEVVVLIRDQSGPQVVCPFSFSDMDQAHSWLAREAARGLRLRSALVYWALPARISRDHSGNVHITPAEPPALRRPQPVDRAPEAPTDPAPDGAESDEVADILREADSVFEERRRNERRRNGRERPFQGFDSPPGKF